MVRRCTCVCTETVLIIAVCLLMQTGACTKENKDTDASAGAGDAGLSDALRISDGLSSALMSLSLSLSPEAVHLAQGSTQTLNFAVEADGLAPQTTISVTVPQPPNGVAINGLVFNADSRQGSMRLIADNLAPIAEHSVRVEAHAGNVHVAAEFTLFVDGRSGSIDVSYGDDTGRSVSSIQPNAHAWASTTTPDDKLLVCGGRGLGSGNDFMLARLDTAGALDTSFGSDGLTAVNVNGDDLCRHVAIMADGRILATGRAGGPHLIIVRYLADGTLDESFDEDGVLVDLTTNRRGMWITEHKEGLLVVGSTGADFFIRRYQADGTIDASFGTNGETTVDFEDMKTDAALFGGIQSDGRIVVVGYTTRAAGGTDVALVRFDESGVFDENFGAAGAAGLVTTNLGGAQDYADTLIVEKDDRILVQGNASVGGKGHIALLRFTKEGVADPSFGDGGVVLTSIGSGADASDSMLQPDGRVVVTGWMTGSDGGERAFAARYLSDGGIDPQFGAQQGYHAIDLDIGSENPWVSISQQRDGRLLVVSTKDFGRPTSQLAVVRIWP